MSTYLDHIVSDISCRLGAALFMALSPGWRAMPKMRGARSTPKVGRICGDIAMALYSAVGFNDRAESYFEIYSVLPSPAASGQVAEQWRWRLCTADGHVNASVAPIRAMMIVWLLLTHCGNRPVRRGSGIPKKIDVNSAPATRSHHILPP
jgi:hypothetical protein